MADVGVNVGGTATQYFFRFQKSSSTTSTNIVSGDTGDHDLYKVSISASKCYGHVSRSPESSFGFTVRKLRVLRKTYADGKYS